MRMKYFEIRTNLQLTTTSTTNGKEIPITKNLVQELMTMI